MADDDTARRGLARNLTARLHACSHDELRVIDVILTRLEGGREQYGELDLSKPRDWRRERAEEIIDAAFYEACEVLCARDVKLRAIAERPVDEHVDLLDEHGSQQ